MNKTLDFAGQVCYSVYVGEEVGFSLTSNEACERARRTKMFKNQKDNRYYTSIANQEFKRLRMEPKTHIIVMTREGGERVALTKPNSHRITKNSFVRFRRIFDNIEMITDKSFQTEENVNG